MKVRFAKPDQLLSPYIERYWSWENEENKSCYLPHVPPGAGIDLYFHYKRPFAIRDTGILASSHLLYSGNKSSSILPTDEVGFIVVRFRCSMFGNFTPIPTHELENAFVDAGTIWKTVGKQLEEEIGIAETIEERVKLLDEFLLQQLSQYHRPVLNYWKGIIYTLYYHHDEARLDQLAQQMKITPRHFRRVFYEVSGMTPKHFQQLSRFRAVLKHLLINNDSNYLPIALEMGYFDQMHFIKEFKNFMNITPSVFLAPNNFQSHFYYKSFK
ncbi:MAG: uncharacterized protein JWR38_2024 [Mucilaginibacter sp.]|nr:uncharacterized protein [Mucilaginibacter sp.]